MPTALNLQDDSASTKIGRVITALLALRAHAVGLEATLAGTLDAVEEGYRDSARNFVHYLALRQHDLRALQEELASLGLSSLGRLEAHVLSALDAVLVAAHQLEGRQWSPPSRAPVDFRTGPLLLVDSTRRLFGDPPGGRAVRVMVTMGDEAVEDGKLIHDLVAAGMDVMRINCAHRDRHDWQRMIEHLREAEQACGRRCRIYADLPGPKLRTRAVSTASQVFKIRPQRDARGRVVRSARIRLLSAVPPSPMGRGPDDIWRLPVAGFDPASLIAGDVLEIHDCRGKHRKAHCVTVGEDSAVLELDATAYVESATPLRVVRDGEVLAEGWVDELPTIARPIELRRGDHLLVVDDDAADDDPRAEANELAKIGCTLKEAFAAVREGHSVWFDDGKIGGRVVARRDDAFEIEVTSTPPKGGKLRAEKGINLPDTPLEMPALTPKDIEDLTFLAEHVDMVGLSFVRDPADVLLLEEHLHRLGAGHLGIVLKIETARAFENLPELLLTSLRSPPVGVMVARGDLATELGFTRLAEVQEEILWLCEAAHVPVIWATQVLEDLAKRGAPSRAEVTDAAMSGRAECVMLNTGPYIADAVRFLIDVLNRMQSHQQKKSAMLRKLAVSSRLLRNAG